MNGRSRGLMLSPQHAQCSSWKWPTGPSSACSLAFSGARHMQSSRPHKWGLAALPHKDPCPPGASALRSLISVPALPLPCERAGGHLAFLFVFTCFGQAGQGINSNLPGTFWTLFPVRGGLCPTYFTPPFPTVRTRAIAAVLSVAGKEWGLLGLFLSCKWQVVCSAHTHQAPPRQQRP